MLIPSVSSAFASASPLRAMTRLSPVEEVRKVASRPSAGDALELGNASAPKGQSAALVQVSDEARRAAMAAVFDAGNPDSTPEVFTQQAAVTSQGESDAEESNAGDTTTDSSAEGAVEVSGESTDTPKSTNASELDEEDQAKVEVLKKRDREVRTHEQAHKSAGGQHAGAIHFETQRGPDGQSYAVGGHVNIDVSPVADDPHATLAKMQQVMRAALAPADPSSADRAVAAKASSQAAEARQELSAQASSAAAPGQGSGDANNEPEATTEARENHSTSRDPVAQDFVGSRAQPTDQDLSDSVTRALSMVA